MFVADVIDISGIAVITGGASGFGFEVASRLTNAGMNVAILDVSATELATAEGKLQGNPNRGTVLPVHCDVTSMEQCNAAAGAVKQRFPDAPISFLFNNAGILGPGATVLQGEASAWPTTFSVNVFGAVNILKAFLPGIIAAGPLASGKPTLVVTTSSVVGLLNHNIGAYSCSKMACTAVCEQLAIELAEMGDKAGHISPHSLHPTVGATNFLARRNAAGQKKGDLDNAAIGRLADMGMTSAQDICNGLFRGLDRGDCYIIVDHPLDVPTTEQIKLRMEDQIQKSRPRKPEQLAMVMAMQPDQRAAFKERQKKMDAKSKL